MNHIKLALRQSNDIPVFCSSTPFHVEKLAYVCVQAFSMLLADLAKQDMHPVSPKNALLSFFDERLASIDGAKPALWDPISGDYLVGNEWIRLHCNFSKHRAAALEALGIGFDAQATREQVEHAMSLFRSAAEIQERVESLGGCAAVMEPFSVWRQHPLYSLLANSPLISTTPTRPNGSTTTYLRPRWTPPSTQPSRLPLKNLRVLDLTRVLAGPICCKTLASLGASVLHVSSPNLDTLGSLDILTGAGKKSVHLTLTDPSDLDRLLHLIRGADVLLQAYRPGALEKFGLDPGSLSAINPRLVHVNISAYGVPGSVQAATTRHFERGVASRDVVENPWSMRRGFDSLVQMQTGICHEGMQHTAAKPVPLPCQALDHATGWLAACGVLEALQKQEGHIVEVSLARTSVWLDELGRKNNLAVNVAVAGEDASQLFEGAEMEEIMVRGDHSHVLRQLRNPVVPVKCGFPNDDIVLGPPEKLGMDCVDSWEHF